MKCVSALTTTVVGLFLVATAVSQDKPVFDVTKLADRIYKLSTDGGGYTVKVIASVGDDGILLVDAGQTETGEALKAQIESLFGGGPDIIISTHSHIEHTGGNIAFGKGPLIIGHKNLGPRLTSGIYLFDEFPPEALPRITFTDSLSVLFNGEEIKLIAFPGAHDNSDIIVWFTESRVVCVGALSNGFHFPSVDEATGDVLKYAETAQRVIDILPDDVAIIPGHGEDCTMDDFRAFQKMLVRTGDIVREGLAQGKDYATLKEEDVLKDWASFEGSYVDRNEWLKYLVEGYQNSGATRAASKNFFELMYYAIKDQGADAAIDMYHETVAKGSDEYEIKEISLVYIGYKLFKKDKRAEAAKFFELALAEYPEGDYAGLCYNYLGRAYKDMGKKELAIKNFRKALELDPDDSAAAEALQELEKE